MKFNFNKLNVENINIKDGIDVQPISGVDAKVKKDKIYRGCNELLRKEVLSHIMKYEENKSLFHDGGSMARVYEFFQGNKTYIIKELRNTSEIKNGFFVNDVSEEISIQDKLYSIGIRVPMPMMYVEVSIKDFKNKKLLERKLILMEKIDGLSIGDQYRRLKQGASPLLPSDFSVDSFMDKLEAGIKDMHDNGFYHRDLTLNNVMVDQDGNPVIIDFGTSINTNFDPYGIHETMIIKNGKRTIVGESKFRDDNIGLLSIKKALKEMIEF